MSFEGPTTTTTTAPPAEQTDGEVLPLPAIICIAIGGYVLIIVIILFIRSMLMQRGLCKEQCSCCGKEGNPHCCECWIAFADSCNCCKNPNIDACLDSCCPTRKKMDCADIIMCQCCSGGGCCGMCSNEQPICDWLHRGCTRDRFNEICEVIICCPLQPIYSISYCCSHVCPEDHGDDNSYLTLCLLHPWNCLKMYLGCQCIHFQDPRHRTIDNHPDFLDNRDIMLDRIIAAEHLKHSIYGKRKSRLASIAGGMVPKSLDKEFLRRLSDSYYDDDWDEDEYDRIGSKSRQSSRHSRRDSLFNDSDNEIILSTQYLPSLETVKVSSRDDDIIGQQPSKGHRRSHNSKFNKSSEDTDISSHRMTRNKDHCSELPQSSQDQDISSHRMTRNKQRPSKLTRNSDQDISKHRMSRIKEDNSEFARSSRDKDISSHRMPSIKEQSTRKTKHKNNVKNSIDKYHPDDQPQDETLVDCYDEVQVHNGKSRKNRSRSVNI